MLGQKSLLLIGTQRKDLRQACLGAIREMTASWPAKRAILIVPEQTKLETELEYLGLASKPGLMLVDVLSFRRLAWRLLGEAGKQPQRAVEPVGQAMMLYRIMRDNQDTLHSFGHLAEKPGFVSQVAAALGDLKRYQVDAGLLRDAAMRTPERALQHKTEDLAAVMAAYQQQLLQGCLSDADDDLSRLADALIRLSGMPAGCAPWPWSRLDWLRSAHIWLMGFGETRAFTPQEEAVIKGLAALAERMTITAAADFVPADRTSIEDGSDSFLQGRRTAYQLLKSLPGIRTQKVSPSVSSGPSSLAALLLGLAGRKRDLPDKASHSPAAEASCDKPDKAAAIQSDRCGSWLNLVQAPGLDDELSWIAGEIRRLVQTGEYRYRDITLALCNTAGYAPRLRAVFREYGIPLFLDMERQLGGTPLMRFVTGLLDIGLNGWSRRPLMACLRSGLTGLTLDEIDQMENYWLARGLFRSDRLFDNRFYEDSPVDQIITGLPVADDADEWDDAGGDAIPARIDPTGLPVPRLSPAELAALRDQALLPLRDCLKELAGMPAAADKIDHLRRFLRSYGIPDRISQRSDRAVADQDMDAAVIQVQSWNIMEQIFDQLHQITGSLALSMQTFRDMLAAGMASASSGVIPSAIDQVSVGNLERAILHQPRILFIAGMTSEDFPPSVPAEGLLKDVDRQHLSGVTGRNLPSYARDRIYANAYMVYCLLTLPSHHLYLSVTGTDVSRRFADLAAHYPDRLKCLPDLPAGLDDVRLYAARPARSLLGALRSRPGLAAGPEAAWQQLEALLMQTGRVLPQEHPADDRQPVASSLMQKILPDPLVLSISQLERYAACPFRHFAERMLLLKERPEWAPQAAETGTVLHSILELAVRHLSDELHRLPGDDLAARQELLAGWLRTDLSGSIAMWLEETIRQHRLHRLNDDGLRALAGRRIRLTAEATLQVVLRQFMGGDWLPAELEWQFGPHRHRFFDLMPARPDQSGVMLQGLIDRIDVRADPAVQCFRIIDYKSSARKVDYQALYHGLALQLPVYLAAFAAMHPGWRAEDAGWLQMARPLVSPADGRLPEAASLAVQLDKMQRLTGLGFEPDDLELVSRHALRMARIYAGQLQEGHFPVWPSRLSGCPVPCETCRLQAVCRIDSQTGPWRRLPAIRADYGPDGSRISVRQAFLAALRPGRQDQEATHAVDT